MVNTVGSYENKHWHKKWRAIKESLILTQKQREFIVGSLLGDATMRIGKGAKNANIKIEHGLKQKDYVGWKYDIMKAVVFIKPAVSYRYNKNKEKYAKSWWFRTIRHPLFTEIYRKFYTGDGYKNGKKVVPNDIKNNLTPFSLAVWIMDDGSYTRERIDISTYSFSLEEISLLRECFMENFDIQMRYHRDRDKGYRMYCNQRETRRLVKIIHPYIIPSMMYKIGFRNPVTTESLLFA